jgi:hypothetical protein
MLPTQNFVKCDGRFGISCEVSNKAIKYLKKENDENNIS